MSVYSKMYQLLFIFLVIPNCFVLAKTKDVFDDREIQKFVKEICREGNVPEEFEGICDLKNSQQNEEPKISYRGPLRASSDMTYFFYSKRHPSSGFKVRYSTIDLLRFSDFTHKKPTLFIVHGWNNYNESEINYKIKESILQHYDLNVFVVDWSPMAGKNYLSAKNSVVRVGQYLAGFIQQLKEQFGLKLSTVKFVGYSLGAHVCGNAGAALGGVVDRIVGLDPAGPLFTVKNTDNRLDPTDAHCVHIIHTSGNRLGFGVPCGHADYFPNGGTSQPGCGWNFLYMCAHSRAYSYYAESLRGGNFVATRCSSYTDFSRGRCNNEPRSLMGKFMVDCKAKGSYFLDTNDKAPFARGG